MVSIHKQHQQYEQTSNTTMSTILMNAWKCSEIGWFSNVLCLKDGASVHASQLLYSDIPEEAAYPYSDPLREDAKIMSALKSADMRSESANLVTDRRINLSNDQALLLEVLQELVLERKSPSSSNGSGIAVSKLYSTLVKQNKNGSNNVRWGDVIENMSNSKHVSHRLMCSLDGILFQHGWIVLYKQQGGEEEGRHDNIQPYWILPIEYFTNNKGNGLDNVERIASLLIRTIRNDLGHYEILLAKLVCIWIYIQFNIFHILVVNGIVNDHENHGDHWYEDYAESDAPSSVVISGGGGSGDDKSKSFVHAVKSSTRQRRNGESMNLSLLQTYLSWWWAMFNMAEVMPQSMDEKGVRMTFKMLNDAISGTITSNNAIATASSS
jgi:hypothetical protein